MAAGVAAGPALWVAVGPAIPVGGAAKGGASGDAVVGEPDVAMVDGSGVPRPTHVTRGTAWMPMLTTDSSTMAIMAEFHRVPDVSAVLTPTA